MGSRELPVSPLPTSAASGSTHPYRIGVRADAPSNLSCQNGARTHRSVALAAGIALQDRAA
jgi:hypothetical protein